MDSSDEKSYIVMMTAGKRWYTILECVLKALIPYVKKT